jgi:outer membrane receptor protein involved in Fe transport
MEQVDLSRRFGPGSMAAVGLAAGCPVQNPLPTRDVSAQVTFDLVLSYCLKYMLGTSTLSLGVRNLLNSSPPVIYTSFLTYADTGYDFVGRYVYARLDHKF